MNMKDLAEILEEELSEAVEVKNPKSLHRYISLLTGNYVEQNIHDRQYNELSSSNKEMLASMKEGFRRMDERFAAQDKRFEALQKQMDERFAAQESHFTSLQKQIDERFTATQKQMDERFTSQERQIDRHYKLISLGFTAMVLVIAAFNLTIILS
ncbi:MAG TPA: hypothetical protein VJ967_10240 [Clostridia bacterium]|nr:hypothetical protein [Clostridia bacterium]